MPELPEVETVRRGLRRYLLGQKIKEIKVFSSKTVVGTTALFYRYLKDQEIVDITRRGKLLIFHLSPSNLFLLIHLKMTGQLIYRHKSSLLAGGHSLQAKDIEKLPNKHTRAFFVFSGGGCLFFNDLRKFGYLKIVSKKELENILANNYGPEPLGAGFSHLALSEMLSDRKVSIKAALLDQRKLAGLGNIYVDEALFRAGISPVRLAKSLKKGEIVFLYKAIVDILKEAIKYKGTTFRDFLDSSGTKGNFSNHLQVYGRANEKCLVCGGKIVKIRLAGRGTHYCPYCQK